MSCGASNAGWVRVAPVGRRDGTSDAKPDESARLKRSLLYAMGLMHYDPYVDPATADENGVALADELDDGPVAAAGLDVLPTEPPVDSPLVGRDDVLVTPHAG